MKTRIILLPVMFIIFLICLTGCSENPHKKVHSTSEPLMYAERLNVIGSTYFDIQSNLGAFGDQRTDGGAILARIHGTDCYAWFYSSDAREMEDSKGNKKQVINGEAVCLGLSGPAGEAFGIKEDTTVDAICDTIDAGDLTCDFSPDGETKNVKGDSWALQWDMDDEYTGNYLLIYTGDDGNITPDTIMFYYPKNQH